MCQWDSKHTSLQVAGKEPGHLCRRSLALVTGEKWSAAFRGNMWLYDYMTTSYHSRLAYDTAVFVRQLLLPVKMMVFRLDFPHSSMK